MHSGGIVFKSLMIKNGRVFDDVAIPLDRQGLVSIQGDNGVGKSSIWDILETVIYGSTPDGYKKDELTKNDADCEYKLVMEKDNEQIVASLQRRNKKWTYDIQKGSTPRTDHTYYDAIKTISSLVGLTKDEFEGSVHLTQNAQHMLIKGTLSERKDYISSFFGIDNRYDEVHVAAKSQLEKVSERIQRLAGLSHSKQMLENEMKNLEIKDTEALENKLKTLQSALGENNKKLTQIDAKLSTWTEYNRNISLAAQYDSPEKMLADVEMQIENISSELAEHTVVQINNEQAQKVNATIDILDKEVKTYIDMFPILSTDTLEIGVYEKELAELIAIKKQNQSIASLRQEILAIPDVKKIPLERIEQELVSLQVAYQTHLKNKTAKEKGYCSECGSKFTIQDVQQELEAIKEIKSNLDILNQDYAVLKTRNQNAIRRAWILDQIKNVPVYEDAYDDRIVYLQAYIPARRKYEEIITNLKRFERMEMKTSLCNPDLANARLQSLKAKKESLQTAILAKKMLPIKPDETEQELLQKKTELHNQILNLTTFIQTTSQAIGEYKTNNDTHRRLTAQLNDIESKLGQMDELKKEEYFWSRMVDAYGPKGLRVQQLENMMDLIIKQLPVYVSILFNEKNLSFKHKVDANNVRILAHREIVDDSGEVLSKFQHDIGCFSGGEKDKMSAAFILTLADCIPMNKRANILILDEVDAQLDKDGKFRFTNDLLPMLKKKYDSIFVISHDKDVQLANIYDQIWTISKNNHTSELSIQHVN